MDEQRRLCHNDKNYLSIGDMLYRRGVESILLRCLAHEEARDMINDFHDGACGSHLSKLSTSQKTLRVG